VVRAPSTPALMPRTARAVGASVCGVSHTRDGLVNQDALAIWQAGANERGWLVAAVADGHGGARHFRSARGARFAVNAAVNAMRRIAAEWEAADKEKQTHIATSSLPEAIVADWSEQVQRHLAATPISDSEWQTLESNAGEDARTQVQVEPALAYGATLIAALVTSRHILLLQVGDGDAVLVAPDGTAWHPIPPDGRLTGEFTTSICRAGAAADFRHSIVAFDGTASLLILATDGYSNSFRTGADFLQVGTDLLQMMQLDGLGEVEKQLPQILEHASANGSGDDITVALVSLGEPVVARGRATAPSAMRVSELRAELATLRNQARRFRAALAVIAIVAFGTLAWTFRAQIAALAHQVTHAGPESVPQEVKPGEGSDAGSAPVPAAKILVSARHSAQSVKISAKVTFTVGIEAKCTAEETLSAPGFADLGKASQPLSAPASAGHAIQLDTITIAAPKDAKQRKALQSPQAQASIDLVCGGKAIAHATTHIET
jgi:serine/threonine protein phosphatase PrpC